MAFCNNSNTTRIDRCIEALDLIDKSAKSNRADPAEIAAMLAPLIARINAMAPGVAPTPSTAPDTGTPDHLGSWSAPKNAPTWATVHDMAANAPLEDLGVAVAVYINRADEALRNKREGS